MKTLLANPGIHFIARFILLFVVFYYGTYFWIGLCSPDGTLYSPFAARFLNYIYWLRSSILHGGNIASQILGLKALVEQPFLLKLESGLAVRMVYTCIGIGVMSFWSAFVIANKVNFSKKVLWTVAGLLAIWFINCWRIAFLLFVLNKDGDVNRFGEHHNVFNALSYVLVLAMMYFFTRQVKASQIKLQAVND